MERRHWAAAQEIAERWRRHAHAVLARALREEAADDAATAAARLVRFLAKAGGRLRRGDLQRGLNLASAELDAALAAAGPRVRTWEERTRGAAGAVGGPRPDGGERIAGRLLLKALKSPTRWRPADFSSRRYY